MGEPFEVCFLPRIIFGSYSPAVTGRQVVAVQTYMPAVHDSANDQCLAAFSWSVDIYSVSHGRRALQVLLGSSAVLVLIVQGLILSPLEPSVY